jgi:hypothetical protein
MARRSLRLQHGDCEREPTVIHNTYVDETIVHNTTIVNNNHVAYSGGPGGIQHQPTAEEKQFSAEKHVPPTAVQTQHIQSAAK